MKEAGRKRKIRISPGMATGYDFMICIVGLVCCSVVYNSYYKNIEIKPGNNKIIKVMGRMKSEIKELAISSHQNTYNIITTTLFVR